MILSSSRGPRALKTETVEADVVIVGGGLSGTCAALTAARAGIRVILVNDRPVLGGNASSEVRLWVLGATSHMGNNNRWAREGGVIDEILVENTFRNREGNPHLVDALLLEKVSSEANITLLLNTAVFEVTKVDHSEAIQSVRAFCSQNSTMYELSAPLFCDASGDGVLGFLAGAAFRMGAESRDEFGEKFAPSQEYGELLGHSLYFYTKDLGRPVTFIPPEFALKDITRVPRWRDFNAKEQGCKLWWIEYGGRLDTVHATEEIKWELWRVVYGVWNHIKNSGLFPEAANLTLEWVGTIPGKRESRRFEGDTMLRQQDIVEQRSHPDAVAFGGWSIDLHPADGVFSEKPGCNQWHSKGVYQIPYRALYSRNIPNLFLAGRIISATHVAFGSSRVMATCAHIGQAVGMAAALCARGRLNPKEMLEPARMTSLQLALQRSGQHIPGVIHHDENNLAARATVAVTSQFRLQELRPDGPWISLKDGWAMLLPVVEATALSMTVWVQADAPADLRIELRQSSRVDNHTPDVILEKRSLRVAPGENAVPISFEHRFGDARYAFVCFFADERVRLRTSQQRVTGILSLCHAVNLAVAKSAVQAPEQDIGVDTFEFWQPKRRPGGQNIALRLSEPLALFGGQQALLEPARPTNQPNAWVAAPEDPAPAITLQWEETQRIGRVELWFDTDFDHPMETVLWGHPEGRMPFCVNHYRLIDDRGQVVADVAQHHQTRAIHRFSSPLLTRTLRVEVSHPSAEIPAALFQVKCYAE
ncbi:MAG TPA: FAD-dependent oxidoreductase [Opitutaceae bacterium]|nr:FAD-dependent oxidoreductase [Opitutaceae bacterium]